MKKLLLLTLALSLPLAQLIRADDNNDRKRHRRHPEAQAPARPDAKGQRPPIQPVRRPIQQSASRRNVAPVQRRFPERDLNRAPRSIAPVNRPAVQNEARLNREHGNNLAANRERTRNRTTIRNGGNRNFNRNSFSVARSRVIRSPHNRNWWRGHFNTSFVLFSGGYYYWWDGYWFPAYGYDPYYNNYAYDEPIYGYNNLDPGQVIENVQVALRDAGYYPGAIDGLVGPQTRAALAAFQQDHGLIVTEAVDEPTLVTLGLT
ncbi:MAG TPA: peptidoglycan-binding protein [Chthoniobacterales bacterium]|jgi:hypothetical protein